MKTWSNTSSRSIIFTIFATFVALASAAVVAQPNDQVLTKKVAYSDLNPESEQGAKVLYARLRHAAQDVCSPLQSRELTLQQVWRACVDNALASAVTQVNKPRVTALHNQNANRANAG
jgi:UrcA family protein